MAEKVLVALQGDEKREFEKAIAGVDAKEAPMCKWMILLLAIMLALPAVAQAATIEPGVTATTTGTPTTLVTGVNTVTRTTTFQNANLDGTKTWTFTETITPQGGAPQVTQTWSTSSTVSGARTPNYSTTAPVGAVFVLGSLKVNNIAQPDPTITNQTFALSLTLPPATSATTPSSTALVTKWQITVNP